jgi:drug/metabolite transporter (DMT)-like permease
VATTKNDPPAQTKLWTLTKADWKSLIVGVYASLVAVLIVAVALIVTRHLGHIEVSAYWYLGFSVVGSILFALAWITRNVRWLTLLIRLVLGAGLAAIMVFGLLFILGEAAGTH